MERQSFKPIWEMVKELDYAGKKRPCMRGGHQMCIDSHTSIIYLLGGWDGHKDLSDLWSFNIKTGIWKCISNNVEECVRQVKYSLKIVHFFKLLKILGWTKSSVLSQNVHRC